MIGAKRKSTSKIDGAATGASCGVSPDKPNRTCSYRIPNGHTEIELPGSNTVLYRHRRHRKKQEIKEPGHTGRNQRVGVSSLPVRRRKGSIPRPRALQRALSIFAPDRVQNRRRLGISRPTAQERATLASLNA